MEIEIVCADLLLVSRIRGVLQGLPVRISQRRPGSPANGLADLRIVDMSPGLVQLRAEIEGSEGRPVIAFGPHVARELFAGARALGCAQVLSHGALGARLRPTVMRLLAVQP